jgi:hypothetical protein
MPPHCSIRTTYSEERSDDPERRVEQTDALLQETVELLSRGCPADLLEAAAYDDLVYLRPHLQGALAALEDIEGRRSLAEEELARRRAFKMLLAVMRQEDHR